MHLLAEGSTRFRARMLARSHEGRTKAKLQLEVTTHDRPFDLLGTIVSPAWVDTGVEGTPIEVLSGELVVGKRYRWRARLLFQSGATSRWVLFDRGGTNDAWDLLTVGPLGSGTLVLTDGETGAQCPFGGLRLISGLDDGDGHGIPYDGVLQFTAVAVGNGEIDAIAYVCNGAPGGLTSLVVLDGLVGTGCDEWGNGGLRVRSGLDLDGDGVLADGEVLATGFVCHGADGADGADSLVAVDEQVGTACDAFGHGGQRLRFGRDLDRSGLLEDGEVEATTFVCHGADGTPGAPGHDALVVVDGEVGAACDAFGNGGQRVRAGTDLDDDGALGEGEVSSTMYVCHGADGASGPAGLDALLVIDGDVGTACDDAGNGGQRLRTGADADADGTLDDDEVTATTWICHGADGVDGTDGHDALVRLTTEPPGPNCPDGGKRLAVGTDEDGDGDLAPAEVSDVTYLCGAAGLDGTNGQSYLLAFTAEPPGAACADGGTRVDGGLDADGDGALGDDEVTATAWLCAGGTGLTALVAVTAEPPGAACPFGGYRVESGLDDDRDGALAAEEVDATAYVCHGAAGAQALVETSEAAPGAPCPAGGTRVAAGVDQDGDEVLAPAETTTVTYVCDGAPGAPGADGRTALVGQEPEPPGPNCPAGGVRVDTGLDLDEDGSLAAAEVQRTTYVCHGADGSAGADGRISLAAEKPEPAGPQCPHGGTRLDFGLDEDGDGELDPAEVLETLYVCDGQPGDPGQQGAPGTLVATADEPPGENCSNGGLRLDSGLDENRDGQLQPAEITATSYLCQPEVAGGGCGTTPAAAPGATPAAAAAAVALALALGLAALARARRRRRAM